MRLVWTTDPHLNHVPVHAWDGWVAANLSRDGDGIIVSGDISEGDDVVFQLRRIYESLRLPIYFVLGNHDFYQSSIAKTRQQVIEAAREESQLFYLTDLAAIELSAGVFLLGEDGWGDATIGDYEGSIVKLNDFALIDDFRLSDPNGWQSLLQQQGMESAQRLEQKLQAIPRGAREVIVVTHVPPFRQACWYQGRPTDDNWAPFFVCGQIGEVLRRSSQSRPDCKLTVLCGHTHNAGIAAISDNLTVYTGAADYGQPMVEGLVQVSQGQVAVTLDQF